jgi:outer membrane protein TolC
MNPMYMRSAGRRPRLLITAAILAQLPLRAAWAQEPASVDPGRPAQPAATQPIPTPAAAQGASAKAGPTGSKAETALTADAVARRAAETSYNAKAAEESVRATAARVDQAWMNFLPRLTATGRYTRLSDFTPPPLFTGPSINFVGTTTPAGQPPQPGSEFAVNLFGGGGGFPIIVNNYLLQASIVVPISDYFLRINEGYTAATKAEDAARADVDTARAKSSAEGKLAFYSWLRARGALVVAQQALVDAKTHLTDAQNVFTVGQASKADVLRAETGVAAAELAVERTKNLVELTEKQVRVAMHAADEERLSPVEDLEGSLPPVQGSRAEFEREAVVHRPELRSVDANLEVLGQQAKVAKALYYPQIAGVGNVTYANPNQRRIPQSQDWFPTWDVSAQLTWSPNDALLAAPTRAEPEARVAQLRAQRKQIEDGLALEVTQAFQAIREADVAMDTSRRQVQSAQEAYRVARELFNAGRATSTTLTDAETDLTRARLEVLNARVDARVARVRLEHAVGRDARQAPAK